MKKIIAVLAVILVAVSSAFSVSAADGKVTYSGNSGSIIFEPGSEHSPTDLFPDFKDVMSGDTFEQKITIKNKANNKVKVKLYLRSLGAHEDSVDFLSQLNLKVKASKDNEMAYMFDAAANETAGLTDWVYLGTIYSGGEVNLDVILNVPVELSSEYQDQIGYIDWEFKIEELPVEPDDPKPPKTGDDSNLWIWVTAMFLSGAFLIILIIWRKKNKDKAQHA